MSRVFDEDADLEPTPEPPQGGRLAPAGWRLVLVLLVIGVLSGQAVILLLRLLDQPLPVPPWTLWALLLVLAEAAWLGSRRMRAALADPARRPSAEVGVALFTVGRSMLATGLLVAGAHLPYVASQLTGLEVPLFRERALGGAITVVAASVFAWAGWRLEEACRVPEDRDR